MEEAISTKRLPETDSIQELAHFWDTHDLTDFADDLKEVTDPVFKRLRPITLRLESSEAEAVRILAKLNGVNDAELVREWVLEKINAT